MDKYYILSYLYYLSYCSKISQLSLRIDFLKSQFHRKACSLAIPVVEFSREWYKIQQVFG
jgi:hypothetical protein